MSCCTIPHYTLLMLSFLLAQYVVLQLYLCIEKRLMNFFSGGCNGGKIILISYYSFGFIYIAENGKVWE